MFLENGRLFVLSKYDPPGYRAAATEDVLRADMLP